MALGLPHPDYLLDLLTAEQLAEWEMYNRLEPIGEYRRELQFGLLCSLVYNIAQAFLSKGGRRLVATPYDFMPFYDERPPADKTKPQSVEEMKMLLSTLATSIQNRKKDEKEVKGG